MAIPERRKRRIRRFLDNALFFGNVIEYKDYIETARKYLHAVRRTQSTRLIVLETWLFVDYTLRQLLMHGLELTAIDQEELDLRYNLLPRSFGACIDLLVRLRKTNHQLPPKPGERALRIPGRMMDHFDSHHPGLIDELAKAETCYRNEYGLGHPISGLVEAIMKYRFVPDGWLDVADHIDENWQREAKRLNDARNLAAHSHSNERIAARLGFNGTNAPAQARKYCLSLVEKLIGVRTIR